VLNKYVGVDSQLPMTGASLPSVLPVMITGHHYHEKPLLSTLYAEVTKRNGLNFLISTF
jgi:hypothetical protein